ncbi:hypothetical protein MAC_06604 [Metarhizium acridum CQMa 102]|uniref:Cyanovirin-N domain-containing protein n=1 Tax=Metarhizium acridum (strain CQMa 102) TaxID=655827 RepID=E9E9Q6_METAQ|nr:uncharacterized protein MAC_06604 [Metarhizium acridum CQMa 102]EFY87369.1 hypothetical protein MAC_06604 [Metarhizium acridum CQMa 102]
MSIKPQTKNSRLSPASVIKTCNMSFYESSKNIWLEDGHILHADCQDDDGNWNESTIDLNEFIGNSDGWFEWDGVNFSESAHDILLDGSRLTAEMGMVEGGNRERQGLELNDRIGNENGQLVYRN